MSKPQRVGPRPRGPDETHEARDAGRNHPRSKTHPATAEGGWTDGDGAGLLHPAPKLRSPILADMPAPTG